MTGARNSTRLNFVPMGLVGRARAAGISNFASQVEPHSDRALLRLSHDRSPLPHFLFALSPAHPLLAPLPAHLSALLPSPRRAFHRVAGARVASFPISSFPCLVDGLEFEIAANPDFLFPRFTRSRTRRCPALGSSDLRPTRGGCESRPKRWRRSRRTG